jgi:hypothetical protein
MRIYLSSGRADLGIGPDHGHFLTRIFGRIRSEALRTNLGQAYQLTPRMVGGSGIRGPSWYLSFTIMDYLQPQTKNVSWFTLPPRHPLLHYRISLLDSC